MWIFLNHVVGWLMFIFTSSIHPSVRDCHCRNDSVAQMLIAEQHNAFRKPKMSANWKLLLYPKHLSCSFSKSANWRARVVWTTLSLYGQLPQSPGPYTRDFGLFDALMNQIPQQQHLLESHQFCACNFHCQHTEHTDTVIFRCRFYTN